MNRNSICTVILILSTTGARAFGGQAELKVVVPGVHAYAGVPAGTDGVLSDLLLNALLARHGVHATGPADVRALLTAEQQKNLLGCSDESCMAELAGALGADWLIGGSVGRLEDLFVLTLQLIDARKARVTSRASVNLKSLKDATGKIGPLVDELLGARPRHKVEPAILDQAPTEKYKSLDRAAFCKLNKEYVGLLGKAPYDPQLVELRRKILLDLVLTPFQREFDAKRSCIWTLQGRLSAILRRQLIRCATRKCALDTKHRQAEFATFIRQVEIVQDEYVRALKMEENGTGKRLTGLPFEVNEVHRQDTTESDEIRAYRAAYRSAVKILDGVFTAARKKRPKTLRAFFRPPDPSRSVTGPREVFRQLRNFISQGYKLRTCPLDVLSNADIEQAAARFGKKHVVEGCWLRGKKDSAALGMVWITKHKGVWKIDRW
ncbi:MAG TPA: hypothetical protein VM425_01640 [Myxococcota bacterium]|nr:hypothetical protein [Myxococcota bacterium]